MGSAEVNKLKVIKQDSLENWIHYININTKIAVHTLDSAEFKKNTY